MGRYRHLVFVCQNSRDPADPRGSCKARGSDALLDRLKELNQQHGQKGQVRITSSGCLDYCKKGIAAAVFSRTEPAKGAEARVDETWYTHLVSGDADKLYETHILRGERLTERREPNQGG